MEEMLANIETEATEPVRAITAPRLIRVCMCCAVL